MEYQDPAHQKPKPDFELVEKYHAVQDERKKLEQRMQNLQEQNRREKKAGKLGQGDEISKISKKIEKLCSKEEKYRKQADQQVEDRGGVVDAVHRYASHGGTRYHTSHRRPRSQNRRETPKPGEYLDRDKSTQPAGPDPQEIEKYGRKHKKFAHHRADAALKRSRLPSDGSPAKPSRDVVIGFRTFWDKDGNRRGRSRSESAHSRKGT